MELIKSYSNEKLQFDRLSRNEFSEVINQARLRGYDLSTYDGFHEAIRKFKSQYEERSANAENTQRNLTQAWNNYLFWCRENNCIDTHVPASPEQIENYLNFRATFVAKGTLALDCWAISTMHKISGCPDPFNDFNLITTKKKLFRKLIIESDGVKQAYAFRMKHLLELFGYLIDTDDLGYARLLCVAAVSYESMLRESEMVRIKISHITESETKAGYGILKIPYTKTNKSGESEYCELSPPVMKAVNNYLRMCKRNLMSDGYLLAGLTKTRTTRNNNKPLSVDVIDNQFKEIHVLLDLEGKCPRFSSHSARVGAAQDMAVDNHSIQEIQKSGRWKSPEMVYNYCKKFAIEDSGMSKLKKKYSKYA
jgi:integrase